MASTVSSDKPAVDYFSLSTLKPQNTSFISPPAWDSSPHEFPLSSPESCESFNPSPISSSLSYPAYNLPSTEDCTKDPIFNYGSFDDWMGWDDPTSNGLSPEQSFFPEIKEEPLSPGLDMQSDQDTTLAPLRNGTDGPTFREDPLTEEPLFQTPSQPQEELYSTPLSWSRPSPGPRTSYTRLSPQEESQLRAIAMPSLSTPRPQSQLRNSNKGKTYPASPSTTPSSPTASPRRKRKSSFSSISDDDEEPQRTSSGRHPAPKKTAHNMIEKRYRTNLNDKIAALRDSVPALRVVGSEREEDLQGLTPAHKLNKATILSKATEYISHLEKRNKNLLKENATLKSRVEAFEILMMARQEGRQMQGQVQGVSGRRPALGEREVGRFSVDRLVG